jgi:hypothetical protein
MTKAFRRRFSGNQIFPQILLAHCWRTALHGSHRFSASGCF